MRGRLLAPILLSACYAPTFSTGAPCTADSECPDHQKCTAMLCEYQVGDTGMPGPDAPMTSAADRDQDGVPDATDNCPDIANADQSNVDGDTKGDVCDRCAQISDLSADADADGVGDACDPDVAAKDAIWLFDPLHKLPSAWAPTVGWSLIDGVVTVAARGNKDDDDEFAYPQFTPPVAPIDNFAFTAVFRPTALTGDAADHFVGLELWDANNNRGVDCGVDQGSNGSGTIFLEEVNMTGPTRNLTKSTAFGWSVNSEYRLVETRHGTTYNCLVVGPDGVTATLSGASNVVPRDGSSHSVYSFGVTMQLKSFAIIGAHP